MYTTSYPIARISLTLLYHRIFLQSWIRGTCWFLIFCYTGYAVGSFIADICQFWPIESSWDLDVKRTHAIDLKALYLANTGFNIATDAILLFLPLVAIWDLRMTRWRKIGLGLIFCLGCLTVIASIFRLSLYHQYNTLDPNCKQSSSPSQHDILKASPLYRRPRPNPMVDPRRNGPRDPLPLLRNHATPAAPRLRLLLLSTFAPQPIAPRTRHRGPHNHSPSPNPRSRERILAHPIHQQQISALEALSHRGWEAVVWHGGFNVSTASGRRGWVSGSGAEVWEPGGCACGAGSEGEDE